MQFWPTNVSMAVRRGTKLWVWSWASSKYVYAYILPNINLLFSVQSSLISKIQHWIEKEETMARKLEGYAVLHTVRSPSNTALSQAEVAQTRKCKGVSQRALYSSTVQHESTTSLQALLSLKLWHKLDEDWKAVQKQGEYSFSMTYISLLVLLIMSKLAAFKVPWVYMLSVMSLGIWKTALC